MRGSVEIAASAGGQGVILGEDGSRYSFTLQVWRNPSVAVTEGVPVEFESRGSRAVSVSPVSGYEPPASELFDRIEGQVVQSTKDNFRRGLLIGLGFLLLFLLLETIMDTVFIAREVFLGGILIVAAAAIAFNLWQLVRKFLL